MRRIALKISLPAALAAAIMSLAPVPVLAEMAVALNPPWDGQTIPADQVCALHGGQGMTPPMTLTGLPEGTASVAVEYNDISFPSLAFNGGHGAIGFAAASPDAVLPPMPAMTAELPEGAWVISAARTHGQYASPGYIPPCSGGNGHTYQAVVRALDAGGNELDSARVVLGRY